MVGYVSLKLNKYSMAVLLHFDRNGIRIRIHNAMPHSTLNVPHLHYTLLVRQLHRKSLLPQKSKGRREKRDIYRCRKKHNHRIKQIKVHLRRRNRREITLLKLNHSVYTPTNQEELRKHGGVDDGCVRPFDTTSTHDASRRNFVPDDQGEEETEGGEVDGETSHESVLALLLFCIISRFIEEEDCTAHLNEERDYVAIPSIRK